MYPSAPNPASSTASFDIRQRSITSAPDTYRRLGVFGQSQVRPQHGQVVSGISLHLRVAASALFLPEYGDSCPVTTDGDPGEGEAQHPSLLALDPSHHGLMPHAPR